MRSSRLVALLAAAALALSSAAAWAQQYPERMVRIVVPYPPGGGVDGLARPLADQLSQRWGQTVLVDNKPGGGTIIGIESVLRGPRTATRCC